MLVFFNLRLFSCWNWYLLLLKAIYNMKWASNWKTNTTFTFTTFWAYGLKVVLFFQLEAVFTLKSALKVECQTQKHQVVQFPKKLVIFNKIIHFYPILDFVQIFWHMSNILDKTCVQCTEGPALLSKFSCSAAFPHFTS